MAGRLRPADCMRWNPQTKDRNRLDKSRDQAVGISII
jgi:hypothetical protein